MRKNTRRVLALVMTLALILGNFTGIGTTSKAADEYPEVTKVSVNVSTIPVTGATVEVAVEGTALPEKLYYRVQEAIKEMPGKYTTIVQSTEINGTGANGGKIQIPIGKNEGSEPRTIRIGVNNISAASGYKYSEDITQAAAGGQTSTVDKTELEKAIKDAEACKQSDYTTEAWTTLQSALEEARKVKNDSTVTEEAVKDAIKALNDAVANRKPATDDSVIKAKVVDDQGNPVSNVVFKVIEYSGTKEEIAEVTSNDKGIVEYSTKKLNANGEYQLKAPMNDSYIFRPNDGYIYRLDAEKKVSKVTQIDYTPYEGEEVVFTAKKKGGGATEPEQPSKDTLKINVVDEQGAPIVDPECKFAIVDIETQEGPYAESVTKYPKNGVFTVKFPEAQKGAIIRLASKTKDFEVISELKQLNVTLERGVIDKVNDEPYDGTQEYTFKVKHLGSADDKATIKSAILSRQQLTADGGEVALYVAGTKLNDNLEVVVKSGGQVTDIQVTEDLNSSDTMHSYTINFPANDTKEDKVYNVCCRLKDSGESYKDLTVTVAGQTESGGGEQVDPEGEVTITELTSDVKDKIPKLGATVNISVKGEHLGYNNWGAKAVPYINVGGGEMHELSGKTVEATNVTPKGAQIEIPRGRTDATEWRIIAGALNKDNGEIVEQKRLVLTQEAAPATQRVEITNAVLVDTHTVEIEFEKAVQIAPAELTKELYDEKGKLKEEEFKKFFYITSGVSGIDRYDILEDDTINVDGKKLTITFADGVSFNNAHIHILEGALATKATTGTKLITALNWAIDSKPMVYDVVFDKDTFDYKGGKVVARVKGSRLDELSVKPSGSQKADLTATVKSADKKGASTLDLEIAAGSEPVITFEVPENTTDRTQSYILDMKIQGRPVYGGTGLRGHRFVVSVLPKGTDASAQTLSSLTITAGNNKDENADPSHVTVTAQPGVEGALKTELRLTGTNLDATKTEVRAIDENGVIWPISHVPE